MERTIRKVLFSSSTVLVRQEMRAGQTRSSQILSHATNAHNLYRPYNAFLPKLGYAICWVNFPGRSLGDLQVSAEYVAYNIGVLAKSSATGQVVTIGHSQGAGLNIQWALLYWPSTRKLVSRYIGEHLYLTRFIDPLMYLYITALSGDFHGTVEGPIACLAQDLLRGGCLPAIIQQTVGSHMLAAQNVRGNQSLVPTTSIYTYVEGFSFMAMDS